MEEKIKVLILEDLPSDAELAEREVKAVLKNYKTVVTDTEQGFIKALENFKPDLIISDYMLPSFNGMKALQITRKKEEFIPFIILTGSIDEETAVECLKAGADDYVIKEHIKRLEHAIISALDKKKIRQEQKQAEEKLKESEEKYRKIFENVQDIFYQVDTEGNIIEISPSIKRYSGYSREELIGTPVARIYQNPNDRALLKAELEKNGEVAAYELRLNKKSKQLIYVSLNAHILYDENKKPAGIEGSLRDITARKQAEEELKKLSTAVQQSPSIIIITDTDGNLEYVNPKFTEITGYSQEEIIGQNPRILQSGEHPAEMYKEFWETISSGKTYRCEMHNKKKNGELFWESASVSPIFDEQGKIVNYIKDAEDITERKQAEENFRNSIDESPLGIRIVNQAGKTIYVNTALLAIYEFSSLNEFINTNAIERYTEQSYQEHQERKKIRKAGGDTSDYEISIRRKNGVIRHIKVWRKEVIWNREKHFQVINQDVTELKQLNNDLILAKEKAEESNHLKTAFLNNMSHEIRTPLNGITGFIGLLQNSEIDDEQKQHYFEIINKSSDRLIATVTDILDISRIETGEVKVSKTAVSANEILEELYNFFYHQAKSKGIVLNYKPSLSDREARFVTDKHKLEGILTNLIKNAIKFTGQGEITFACSVKKEQDIDVMEFYVKDTGIGIPTNRIDAIFNRFEQADIADTRAFQGSGLGLAIAKSYVEMLGGKISVKSIEGEGSTFTFSLPFTKPFEKESDAKGNGTNETKTALNKLSVIIAEDDETSIMFFDAIFKNEFHQITYTKTGQETVDKCRDIPETALILMDIKMPDVNGFDATREIRKFNSDVVIIAQTAFGLTGDREKALKAGCNDYISKPINKKELFDKIYAALNKQKND